MNDKKNTANIILGIISIAAAIAMAVNTVITADKYSDTAKPDDIRAFCIAMTVGTAIMVIIGSALIKSRKSDTYKRIALMLLLLLAAGYGTACLNSMLGYVVASYNYEES